MAGFAFGLSCVVHRGYATNCPHFRRAAWRRTKLKIICSAAALQCDVSIVQSQTARELDLPSVHSLVSQPSRSEARKLGNEFQHLALENYGGGGAGGKIDGNGDNGDGEDSNNGILALGTLVAYAAGVRQAAKDAVLCCGTFVLADLLAQLMQSGSDFDTERLLRLAIFGLLIKGPAMSWFYKTLDRTLPGNSAVRVAKKVVVDQTCWSWINNAAFLFMIPLMEGRPVKEAAACVTENFPSMQKTAYILWPAAHIVNFAIIPSACRTIYVSAVSFTWTAICCLLHTPQASGES